MRNSVSLAGALLLAAFAPAQSSVALDAKRDLGPPESCASSHSVFAVDFDQDGRQDLLFGHEFTPYPLAVLRRGVGDGRFEPVAASGVRGWLYAYAAADLDGDGRIEIVGERQIHRLAVDGTIETVVAGVGDGPAAVGDVDGDGRLDFVRADRTGLALYLQTGPLAFSLSTGLQGDGGAAIRLGDLDGDRDLDVLVARDPAANGLFLNDGQGVFSDASSSLPSGTERSIDCAILDLDGDGATDVVFLNRAPDLSQLLYQRGGVLVDASGQLPLPVADHVGLAIGDVDGDGRLDVAVASDPGGSILRGAVGGWFVAHAGAWPRSRANSCVALVDVDGDADLDLVEGSRVASDRLHFNDGAGRFVGPSSRTQRCPWSGDRYGRYAVLGDFDADGDPDVVAPGTFWRNDGFGAFDVLASNAPALPGGFSVVAARPAVGDLDGDGQLDLVVPSAFDRFRVHRGHGHGVFGPGREYVAPVDPPSQPWEIAQRVTVLALHDLDGDGDLDLLCGASEQDAIQPGAPARDSLWRNDGRGTLVEDADWLTSGTGFCKDVAFGDLNGDGRVDFVDGLGSFLQAADGRFDYVAPDPAGWLWCGNRGGVELADLDGDGDLDAVVASACYGTPWCEGEADAVGWNDGSGVLFRERLPYEHESHDVALLDADGDGDLDAFFGLVDNGVHGTAPNELWINGGGRSLRRATFGGEVSEVWRDSWLVLGADLDADGDVDLFTLDNSIYSDDDPRGAVWWNRTRHLHAPDLLRVGRGYELELHGPVLGGAIIGSPFLARVPVPPFGVLGVHPGSAVLIASFAGPTHGRLARHELTVPIAPVLIGAVYAFQAAVVDPGGALRLTSRVVETILAD